MLIILVLKRGADPRRGDGVIAPLRPTLSTDKTPPAGAAGPPREGGSGSCSYTPVPQVVFQIPREGRSRGPLIMQPGAPEINIGGPQSCSRGPYL